MPDYQQVAAELEVALKKQLTLFKEVRDISASQKQYIEAGDADTLMHLINEKQTRLDKIANIDLTAAPLKQRRDAELDRWSADARAHVDPLIRELQDTLGEIVKYEEECRELGNLSVSANTQKVGTIQRGKAMLNAYGKAARGGNGDARYANRNV
ncbi:hypothetical protein FACS1894139_14060 [Planctomycetales bacterium]|nr:hypothetical protein FACS1894107_02870 [Planctomycetales bacterium]GHS98989.1 hypothetical protein FACS1894108_08150 [Planctomycetales bacterium]GHT06968.1 hypothetical protein FACS1894139_14060 [Planctomycetales bacterium]